MGPDEGKRRLSDVPGTGLCGIICALAGAKEVTVTDHPTPILLSTLLYNITHNHLPATTNIQIQPHQWGHFPPPTTTAETRHGYHHYTRILAADCIWLVREHRNLIRSMKHFLCLHPTITTSAAHEEQAEGEIWIVAGFHTGRDKVVAFFDLLVEEEGLVLECIWERDVVDGKDRPWSRRGWRRDGEVEDEEEEDVQERKRWVVIAVVKRLSAATTAITEAPLDEQGST